MTDNDQVRKMAKRLETTPQSEVHELAEKLHAALQKSKRFNQYAHVVERTGNSAAIQLKHSTPRESIGEITGSFQTILRQRGYTISEHQGGGQFTPGILITPSIAERRIRISKIG